MISRVREDSEVVMKFTQISSQVWQNLGEKGREKNPAIEPSEIL
jgi:hypothetical protein